MADFERIYASPALMPQVTAWIQNYRLETGQTVFSLSPITPLAVQETLQDDPSGVYITASLPPSEWWASPLGDEAIAVVTSASTPIDALSRSELIQVLSGQIENWEDWIDESQPIEVVFPFSGDEVRARFLDLLAPGMRIAPDARLSSNPSELADLIAEQPGRIGILPFSQVDERLNVVQIDDFGPQEDGYPFILNIVATSPRVPEGTIRSWIAWIQAPLVEGMPAPTRTITESMQTQSMTPATIVTTADGTATPPPTRTPAAR